MELIASGLGITFAELLAELGYLKIKKEDIKNIVPKNTKIDTIIKNNEEVKIIRAANSTGLTADEIADYLNNLSKYIKKNN